MRQQKRNRPVSALSRERLQKLAYLRTTDPAAWHELVDLIFETERHSRREEYEHSFAAFVRAAWNQIDAAPLSLAWLHEVIIENLEAVCSGEIRHLIINQPPRTSKTPLVSILYPAWVWCRSKIGPQSGPQVKLFCVSYLALLAEASLSGSITQSRRDGRPEGQDCPVAA
jgi:hypothetical protein